MLDAETGQVLQEVNADAQSYPASLTKMMTLYLVFEGLETGKLKLDQRLPVSLHAANRAPSKLGLMPGETIAVRDLILALVTKSANDCASVAAEALGGTEGQFAEKMTAKARKLGMTNTVFRNASGLPDPGQHTTARDLAKLARAIYKDFPQYYPYFATRDFSYGGRVHANHNHLMSRFEGMDGIKTGFINASGFNLAASAVRNNRRLIGVVMGGQSARSRDDHMATLLNEAFATKRGAPTTTLVADAAADEKKSAPASSLVAEADSEDEPAAPSATARALHALSPISRAEAAPAAPRRSRHVADASASRWSVQLGAYSKEAAAEKAASHAAGKLRLKGHPVTVVAPSAGDKEKVYRARLANFSKKEANDACHALKRKKIGCTVVAPSATKVAART